MDLIDRINKKMVALIPDPPLPLNAPFLMEVQVASFLEKERALRTVEELKEKGLKPRIDSVTLGDRLWHRIILGPYQDLSEAEKIRQTLKKESPFQPIFIRHYPERTGDDP